MRAIYPGMKVHTPDGDIMMVTDVLIDSSDHTPRYLVLNPWGYFGPDVLAPFSAVWRVDDGVHLSLSSDEIAALPRFNHYEHCKVTGLCSRAAWRYGAARQLAPRARPPLRTVG